MTHTEKETTSVSDAIEALEAIFSGCDFPMQHLYALESAIIGTQNIELQKLFSEVRAQATIHFLQSAIEVHARMAGEIKSLKTDDEKAEQIIADLLDLYEELQRIAG